MFGGGQYLPLEFAADQGVVGLHGAEPFGTEQTGDTIGMRDLPGREVRKADVANFALPHAVVQCAQGLIDGRGGIPAVDLVQVDSVCAQPFEAALHLAHDGEAAGACAVDVATLREIHLGGDDDVIAISGERLAQHSLRGAARVGVRCVEEVHPGVEGSAHHAVCGVLALVAEPSLVLLLWFCERHGAEAETGHIEPGAAERDVFHLWVLRLENS